MVVILHLINYDGIFNLNQAGAFCFDLMTTERSCVSGGYFSI